jgi:hypothetical protein
MSHLLSSLSSSHWLCVNNANIYSTCDGRLSESSLGGFQTQKITFLESCENGYRIDFQHLCFFLTLSLPSSNYYTSPPSLSTSNLPPPFPAISCVFYIILPSERKFYPQVDSTRNRLCRHLARVYYEILQS